MKNFLFGLMLLLFFLLPPVTAYAATLTVVDSVIGGTQVNLADADTGSGDVIPNLNGDVLLYLDNPGASQAIVTVTVQDASFDVPGYGTVEQTSKVITLEAGESFVAGPYTTNVWNNSSNQVDIQYSGAGAADVDVGALRSLRLRPQY